MPASHASARECPGGRVRPAAEGRASPFRFWKELYLSSRNGTNPYGPSDSGRTCVLSRSERTGQPVGGRQRSTARSLPSLCVGPAECLRSSAYHQMYAAGRPLLHRDLFSLFSVKLLGLCAVHLPRAHALQRAALHHPPGTHRVPPTQPQRRCCCAALSPCASAHTLVPTSSPPGPPGCVPSGSSARPSRRPAPLLHGCRNPRFSPPQAAAVDVGFPGQQEPLMLALIRPASADSCR